MLPFVVQLKTKRWFLKQLFVNELNTIKKYKNTSACKNIEVLKFFAFFLQVSDNFKQKKNESRSILKHICFVFFNNLFFYQKRLFLFVNVLKINVFFNSIMDSLIFKNLCFINRTLPCPRFAWPKYRMHSTKV